MYQQFRLEPYAVHTTFQYAGTEGKRHRLREAMVFYDPPEYYDSPGNSVCMSRQFILGCICLFNIIIHYSLDMSLSRCCRVFDSVIYMACWLSIILCICISDQVYKKGPFTFADYPWWRGLKIYKYAFFKH